MKVSQAIAIRLRQFMSEKDFSKYRLEMDSGVAVSTINDILYSKREGGNIKILITLIRALGVTVAEFFNSDIFESEDLILN